MLAKGGGVYVFSYWKRFGELENQKVIISLVLFFGIYIWTSECYHSLKLNLLSPMTIFASITISLLTTILHVNLAPIPWVKYHKKHVLVRIFVALLFIVALVGIYTFITTGLAKNLGVGSTFKATFKYNIKYQTIGAYIFGPLIAFLTLMSKERIRAGEELSKIKLQLLNSQMHPHSLMNLLNAALELLEEDVKKGIEAIESIGELLNLLMIAANKKDYCLLDEKMIVEKLIKIHHIHLCDRLIVEWNWDDTLNNKTILPYTLYCLVENAIKHGISKSIIGGTMSIVLKKIDNTIQISVENTGKLDLTPSTGRHGCGIENLKARIKQEWKGKAAFLLYPNEKSTIATLTIPA